MKVVFLKMSLEEKGGLEKSFYQLATAFKEAGCQVSCLTSQGQTNPKLKEIEIIPLSKQKGRGFYALLQFNNDCKKWLSHHTPEIVFGIDRTTCQTHYRAGNGVHAVYLRQRKLTDPILKRWTFSINPLHQTILHLEKQCFESLKLKLLFTNSYMVKDEILENYTVDLNKIQVVHNGVEWNEWQEPFEETFSLPSKQHFQFLFAGHGYRRKGLEFLMKGFSLLKEEATLLIVGKDREADFFKNLAKKLGILDQVTFFGPQPSLVPFYQQADALALPSIYDPFANVTVEALAMGLYVITSPFNGGKEVLTEETGTIITDLQNPDSVLESLKKALNYPKTPFNAKKIRNSIQYLDFSNQLNKIVDVSLKNK